MRKLTKEEITYYANTDDIKGVKLGLVPDDAVCEKLQLMAIGDIEHAKKRRERSEFKTQQEYIWYRAFLIETASRIQHNIPIDYYTED